MSNAEEPDRGVQGWIRRTASKQHWRVASWLDYDDLVQEGLERWVWLKTKYPDKVVNNPAHFMALFKTTFHNHITDLAKARSRLVEVPIDFGFEVEEISAGRRSRRTDEVLPGFVEAITDPTDWGAIAVLLRQAPSEVAAVLHLLATDLGLAKLREPYGKNEDGLRETTNERLCRLTGFDPNKVDLDEAVRVYLA